MAPFSRGDFVADLATAGMAGWVRAEHPMGDQSLDCAILAKSSRVIASAGTRR